MYIMNPLQGESAKPCHQLSSGTIGSFDANFTCRWSKYTSDSVPEKLAIGTTSGVYILDSAQNFLQLSHFDKDHVETFDWCPTEDKIALSSLNSIRVFGNSISEPPLQTYNDIFELESPDGIEICVQLCCPA